MSDLPRTVVEALRRLRGDIEHVIPSKFTGFDTTPGLELLDAIEGALESATGFDERALSGHIRHVAATLLRALERAGEYSEGAFNALESARREIDSWKDILDLRDRAVQEREGRITALEAAIAEGTDRALANLRVELLAATAKIDEVLERCPILSAEAGRIIADAREGFPLLEQDVLGLEGQAAALSTKSAGLLARDEECTADDLAAIDEALAAADGIDRQYRELDELLRTTLQTEQAALMEQSVALERSWAGVRQALDALALVAERLFGERDVFLLIGVRKEVVRAKREQCSALLGELKAAVREAEHALSLRAERLRISRARAGEKLATLASLRERSHVPWYDELTGEERAQTNLALFALGSPKDTCTVRRLAVMFSLSEQTAAEAATGVAESAVARSFFALVGNPAFGKYRLTELGRHWWKRQTAQEPDGWRAARALRERADATIRVEEAEAARARTGRKERQEEMRRERDQARERERAVAEQERHNPVRIRNGLTRRAAELLGACMHAGETLPAPRDAVRWAVVIAAAETAEAISRRPADDQVSGLVELILHDPDFFKPVRSEARGLELALSEVGVRVGALSPMLPASATDALRELLLSEQAWSPKSRGRLAELRGRLMSALPVEIPRERYKNPP